MVESSTIDYKSINLAVMLTVASELLWWRGVPEVDVPDDVGVVALEKVDDAVDEVVVRVGCLDCPSPTNLKSQIYTQRKLKNNKSN